jgi:hypothetical protein
MKNILIAIFIVATIAFGSVSVAQRKVLKDQALKLQQTEARVAALEKELKDKSESIERASLAEQKATVLQKTVAETAAAAVEKSQQVEQLQQKLDLAKTNDMGSLIGNMLKDPKMKDMIKASQKLYIGPMVDKSYGAFVQQMNLSSEQAAGLKDLLQKKMLVATDMGTSMLDSSLDAAQRAELTKQIKTETDAYDAQIKDFLGEQNYKSFQDYEKTVPDRMVVDQFSTQLGDSATLTSDQQSQLIQAMSDERNNFKWTVNFNDQKSSGGDLATMFTDENISRFAQEQEQFDQQFLTRAQTILGPDQLKAFEQFKKSQRDMQIAGMKIAAKMFGGTK